MTNSHLIQKIISTNFKKKVKTSYEISHQECEYCASAWKFANTTNHPFNVHLGFDFERNVLAPEEDILKVRNVAHRVRMWLHYQEIPSHIIWTRTVSQGSPLEEVDLLVHVPEPLFGNFEKNAEGWQPGMKVKRVTYEDDEVFDDKPCTIFEYMFRATSQETQFKIPGVPHIASEPMKGSRTFSSIKLWVPSMMDHRRRNSRKSIDLSTSIWNRF